MMTGGGEIVLVNLSFSDYNVGMRNRSNPEAQGDSAFEEDQATFSNPEANRHSGRGTPLSVIPRHHDESGVDLSLIRYVLQLSPIERLRMMERAARDTRKLNEYGRRSRRTSPDSDS